MYLTPSLSLSHQSLLVHFYGPQGHPYDCFPTGSMYVYIYIFLCPLTRVCVVYVVKEVTSFPGARRVKERAIIDQALHSSRKKSV